MMTFEFVWFPDAAREKNYAPTVLHSSPQSRQADTQTDGLQQPLSMRQVHRENEVSDGCHEDNYILQDSNVKDYHNINTNR